MRLRFERTPPPAAGSMNRMDVACFVGCIARRPTPTPSALVAWLAQEGFTGPDAPPTADAASLLEVPVPIDSWDAFDALFAWDFRPLRTADPTGPAGVTWLGAAVRAFFAHGGRRCYVVRVGDPWAADAPGEVRRAFLDRLVPGLAGAPVERNDRRTWRGLGVLLGLPEVALVCLPDLPDAVVDPPEPLDPIEEIVPFPEGFVDCVEPAPGPPGGRPTYPVRAPRLSTDDALGWWRLAVSLAGRLLADHRRDVQLLASLPLPAPDTELARDPLRALLVARALRGLEVGGLAGRFVQLAWPWVRWAGSAGLPEGLQPPDGLLAGLIASNTLTQGAFTSAAGRQRLGITAYEPVLSIQQRERLRPREDLTQDDALGLEERVCLIGPTPRGPELLSDVTTSPAEAWRPGNVTRLFSVVLRALRQVGDESVFDVSGPQAWQRLRTRVEALLGRLWELGGLAGRTPSEAFRVTCDASTMTQSDLDAGRLIAQVEVAPAAAIERITVVLSVSDEGRVWRVEPLATLGDEEAA